MTRMIMIASIAALSTVACTNPNMLSPSTVAPTIAAQHLVTAAPVVTPVPDGPCGAVPCAPPALNCDVRNSRPDCPLPPCPNNVCNDTPDPTQGPCGDKPCVP